MLVIPFMPMLEQILLLLGLPIALGLIFSHYFPNATKKITKPAQVMSILLFIGMVAVSFSQNFQLFLDNIFYVFFIVLIHNACAMGTGFFGGTLAKVPKADRRSLTVEIGIQNSGLGLILLFNTAIFPAEVWHGLSLTSSVEHHLQSNLWLSRRRYRTITYGIACYATM